MPNPSPEVKHLREKQGRRPKADTYVFSALLTDTEKQKLKKLARMYDITHGSEGRIAGLLHEIASGRLWVLPSPHGNKTEDEGDASSVSMRLSKHDVEILKLIALAYKIRFGKTSSVSGLLRQIACENLLVSGGLPGIENLDYLSEKSKILV